LGSLFFCLRAAASKKEKEENMKEYNNEKQNWFRPKACTVAQAAQMLAVSEKTIRRLLVRGLLCSSKATRKKLISLSEIETFIERTK